MKRMKYGLLTAILTGTLIWTGTALAGNGTIKGIIKFDGTPPRNRRIRMGADPQCMTLHKGEKVYQESVVLNDNATLKNVFVHISSGLEGKTFQAPKTPVTLDQKGCLYHPRVFGIMVGQTLQAKNDDPTLHNVHALSKTKNAFNVAQPIQGMTSDFVMKESEVMLKLKCEVHPWMIGYVGVVTNPYYAVSDEKGSFTLKDVPPGKYTLEAWQEKLGTLTQNVEVADGKTATVEFTFTNKKKAASDKGHGVGELALKKGDLIRFVSDTTK